MIRVSVKNPVVFYLSVCIFAGMLTIIVALLVNLYIETSGKNLFNNNKLYLM